MGWVLWLRIIMMGWSGRRVIVSVPGRIGSIGIRRSGFHIVRYAEI